MDGFFSPLFFPPSSGWDGRILTTRRLCFFRFWERILPRSLFFLLPASKRVGSTFLGSDEESSLFSLFTFFSFGEGEATNTPPYSIFVCIYHKKIIIFNVQCCSYLTLPHVIRVVNNV